MIVEYKRRKTYISTVAAILAMIMMVTANVNQDIIRKLFPVTASAEINNSSYNVVFPGDDSLSYSLNNEASASASAGEDIMDLSESDLLFSVVSLEEDLAADAEAFTEYEEDSVNEISGSSLELTELDIPQVYKIKSVGKYVKNTKAGIKVTEEEMDLFARIVYCEAGAEDMVGMILIADVIINRVNSPRYPNNVKDVILQKGQFSPVGSGWIYRCTPSEAAKEAVRRAMNGEDYSQGAIGFFNRRLAKKSTAIWFDSALRFILKHGEVEYFGFK